ncbi:GNAT family N-acetyltransferase [Mucilaginibacter flavus]|uniref:GNAT family N-acetyltransferase n=1 Tax=Mucilaginibacter flavus TaxID=931504 RepID=UPI0025B4CEA9|nr:GNAT family N-acetyltransferase [Mucilaginibacter flavus]MDN3579699.1 GNAT family N-acetyltransferase [Mucilaginibacter flavus]
MNIINLKRTNSDDLDFRNLVSQLDADLRERNGEMMDIYDQHNVIEKIDTVVIAYLNNQPAGCGCFKPFDAEAVEIKRMFVQPAARGNAISKKVLAELETWARELGFIYTVLETGAKQVEALSLYPKSGYVLIAKYGPYVDLPDSICFRKSLKLNA